MKCVATKNFLNLPMKLFQLDDHFPPTSHQSKTVHSLIFTVELFVYLILHVIFMVQNSVQLGLFTMNYATQVNSLLLFTKRSFLLNKCLESF